MTQKKETPTQTTNGPAFVVWFVPERENAPWIRIGALWPTKSGKGFKLSLDLLPAAKGSTLVMPNEARHAEQGEGA